MDNSKFDEAIRGKLEGFEDQSSPSGNDWSRLKEASPFIGRSSAGIFKWWFLLLPLLLLLLSNFYMGWSLWETKHEIAHLRHNLDSGKVEHHVHYDTIRVIQQIPTPTQNNSKPSNSKLFSSTSKAHSSGLHPRSTYSSGNALNRGFTGYSPSIPKPTDQPQLSSSDLLKAIVSEMKNDPDLVSALRQVIVSEAPQLEQPEPEKEAEEVSEEAEQKTFQRSLPPDHPFEIYATYLEREPQIRKDIWDQLMNDSAVHQSVADNFHQQPDTGNANQLVGILKDFPKNTLQALEAHPDDSTLTSVADYIKETLAEAGVEEENAEEGHLRLNSSWLIGGGFGIARGDLKYGGEADLFPVDVRAEWLINNRFGLQTGLRYSNLFTEAYGPDLVDFPGFPSDRDILLYESHITINLLELPLNFRWYVLPSSRFVPYLQGGLLHRVWSRESYNFKSEGTGLPSWKFDESTFGLETTGWEVGLGGRWNFNERLLGSTTVNYTNGLGDIGEKDNYLRSIALQLRLMYTLGN